MNNLLANLSYAFADNGKLPYNFATSPFQKNPCVCVVQLGQFVCNLYVPKICNKYKWLTIAIIFELIYT